MPPDLLPDVALDVVVPAGTLGFGPSFLVVYAAGLIVPATLLWLALAQLARHLAWARRARELQVLKRLPEAAPGREPRLHIWKATALLGLWIGGLLLYRKIARRKLPWYTQRRLIERDGPGRA